MPSTFIYVSNAEDGDIRVYTLNEAKQRLLPGLRVPAAATVMPLAVSADARFLYAATRTRPYRLYCYEIAPQTGALECVGSIETADSMVNLQIDRSGQWLMAASYGSDSVSVFRIAESGGLADEPSQVIVSEASKPHAIRTDLHNREVYVPYLGSDEIHVFAFDAILGQLSSRPVDVLKVAPGTGPRHLVLSSDDRFMYVLGEFRGTVTVFERDVSSGRFTQIQCVASLPETSQLVPGAARAPSGTPGAVLFDESNAIFCADMHATPDGRFLYTSERTASTISQFAIDPQSGSLRLVDIFETEKQPRSFSIDPGGKFMTVAGQKSLTVSLYGIDTVTGTLSLVDRADAGSDANWVLSVSR